MGGIGGATGDNLKDTLFGTFNQKMMSRDVFERHLDHIVQKCSSVHTLNWELIFKGGVSLMFIYIILSKLR